MKQKFFLMLFLLLSQHCIYVKVYVPGNFHSSSIQSKNFFKIINNDFKDYMVRYYPILLTTLFYSHTYRNEFGTLEKVMEEELNNNSTEYNKTNIVITINKFNLENRDYCTKSVSKVELEILVTDEKMNKEILNFNHKEEIKTYASDCSNILYTLSFFGLGWYVPYLGMKGTRQDQLDYLGRIALLEFFTKLKEVGNGTTKEQ